MNNRKLMKIEDNYFVRVNKALINSDIDVKVGDVFGLEVETVGEEITFKLKRIEESNEDDERVGFWECFKYGIDGSLISIRTLRIGGITMHKNVHVGKDIAFGGINLSLFIGRDFSVTKEKDCWAVRGIY